MKLNIVLSALGLLFVAAPSQCEIFSFIKTHNPVSDYATAKLDEAVHLLKKKVHEEKKVKELSNKLHEHANEITNKVYTSIKKSVQFVEDEVSKVVHEAELENVDVSKCKKLARSLRHAVLSVVTNSTKCLGEKLAEGKALVDDILQRTQTAIADLTRITEEANKCFKHIDGKKVINGFGCIAVSGMKASWAIAKHTPAVALDLKKFTTLISTLESSLIYCVNRKAIETVAQQSVLILDNVKQCVAEKIKGKDELPNVTSTSYYEPDDDDIRYEEPDLPDEVMKLGSKLLQSEIFS